MFITLGVEIGFSGVLETFTNTNSIDYEVISQTESSGEPQLTTETIVMQTKNVKWKKKSKNRRS